MKILLLIFAVYMLVLPCMSCKDADADTLVAQTSMVSSQHPCAHQDDICNPFCACACCGTRVQTYPVTISVSERIINQPKPTFLIRNTELYYRFTGNIWLPPKLS